MSDLLPAVLLNALRQYKFDRSPLWRMADGKDHYKIEGTFRKPTNQRFDKKGAESRRRPTPPAGEWSRQPAPARHPTTRPTPPASRQCRRRRQHRQHRRHYRSTQLPSQCKDHRRQHRSHLHLPYSYTASFSRITTNEEAENKVAGDEHCTHAVLPCWYWGRIPSTWEVRPPGCHLYKVQGHR